MAAAVPHISIIDDDESLRLALVGLIRSTGYDATGFASAEEFLQSGKARLSACVITDIQMPGMSGIDLKQHLVNLQCQLPVIMITGRPDPKLEQKARDAGAAGFLKKPFEAGVLMACVDQALKGAAAP